MSRLQISCLPLYPLKVEHQLGKLCAYLQPSADSRRLPSAHLTVGEFLHLMVSSSAPASFASTAQSAALMSTICWTGLAFDEAPGVSERFAICVRFGADLDQRCVVASSLISLA